MQVGATRLSYLVRALADLEARLKAHGDWMPLGNADEGKPVCARRRRGLGARREEPVCVRAKGR